MSRDIRTLENNDDGFWDARGLLGPHTRRQALHRLEPQPDRTINHVRRNIFTYVMTALAVGSVGATALLVRSIESNPPDINEYRPERINQRVLTDAEILGQMGLCDAELHAESQYQRFLLSHQTSPATNPNAVPTPEALDAAADLARRNNTSCIPRPAHNGLGAGVYQLEVSGGRVTIYPDEYTHFVGAPAEAVCAHITTLQQQRSASTDPTVQQALDQESLLQKAIAQNANITCPPLS